MKLQKREKTSMSRMAVDVAEGSLQGDKERLAECSRNPFLF